MLAFEKNVVTENLETVELFIKDVIVVIVVNFMLEKEVKEDIISNEVFVIRIQKRKVINVILLS